MLAVSSTDKKCRKSWQLAPDCCPSSLWRRWQPVRKRQQPLPISWALLFIIVHGCKEQKYIIHWMISWTKELTHTVSALQLGGLYIWTHTYSLMKKKRDQMYHQPNSTQCLDDSDEEHHAKKFKANGEAAYADEEATLPVSAKLAEHNEENQMVGWTKLSTINLSEIQEAPLLSCESKVAKKCSWTTTNLKDTIHHVVEELMAPPTLSAVCSWQNQPQYFISSTQSWTKFGYSCFRYLDLFLG